ncbi:MAG: thymidylate synthase, partial [Candidatus Nanohaloarchaea archaeon]|nr:thymidylate synthase [Candidatus Nanohaloarchaea archaeon]
MEQYLDLVRNVLADGNYKENRTGVDTISTFMQSYEIDLQEGFPLLTTKKMDGFRWNSLIHELLWYFSGEHHVRNLREETKIWDDWADDDWNLPTAYGRF